LTEDLSHNDVVLLVNHHNIILQCVSGVGAYPFHRGKVSSCSSLPLGGKGNFQVYEVLPKILQYSILV